MIRFAFKIAVILFMAGLLAVSAIGCYPTFESVSEVNGEAQTVNEANAGRVSRPSEVELTMLTNWNGADLVPADQLNNPVARMIKQKTGVALKLIPVKQNEEEKAKMLFTTQVLPDIYVGPSWAGGGEMEVILKAAKEGQLLDLTPYFKMYPNLAKSVAQENVPQEMWDRYFNPDTFGGKSYMLYSGMPAAAVDNKNWLYALYVRKDIVAKIGINPQSVHTPDQLYAFLKAIKDAELQEDGQDIIPLGGFHNGFALAQTDAMFFSDVGSWIVNEDGTVQYAMMTKAKEDAILYTRKLMSEGLIDPEAWVQTAEMANEKISQGRYAVIASHFDMVYEATRGFVGDHPEAEFIPIGPLYSPFGKPYSTVMRPQGSNINFISKQTKNPDAAARLLDFLYSDEGFLLTHYGVEGIHYDMEDGKPHAKPEWVEKMKTNPKSLLNEGILAGYATSAGLERSLSLFGGAFGHEADPKEKKAAEYAKILLPKQISIAKGLDPFVFAQSTEQWQKLKPVADSLRDVTLQAYYAKTEEEAKQLIAEARANLVKAGVHELERAIEEKGRETPLISLY